MYNTIVQQLCTEEEAGYKSGLFSFIYLIIEPSTMKMLKYVK